MMGTLFIRKSLSGGKVTVFAVLQFRRNPNAWRERIEQR